MDVGERETIIEHDDGRETWTVSTSERAMAGHLSRLEKAYPDDVECVAMNDDGSVCYHVPFKWVTIRPPRKSSMTEEQKAVATERLRQYREEHKRKA